MKDQAQTLSLTSPAAGLVATAISRTTLTLSRQPEANSAATAHIRNRGSRAAFARHFFEMFVAMVLGMGIGGAADSLLFALLGLGDFGKYVAVLAVLMSTNMAIGMAVWMRNRGHSWARIGEMAAAMYVPFLGLLGPYWAGVVGRGAVMGGGHMLMLLLMLGAMLLRYGEYSQDHKAHSRHTPDRAHAHHS